MSPPLDAAGSTGPYDRHGPRTKCKICWLAVYSGDEVRWVVSPSPGIAHSVCVQETARM